MNKELKELKEIYDLTHNNKCKNYNKLSSVLPPARRIIVVGDLHGDFEMTLESLKVGKVIDNNNNWIGGDTIVVQLGDQVDRCRLNQTPCDNPLATKNDENSDIKILEFFTELHDKASKKGGAVYSIMGNHEFMNVQGDMRYVSFLNLKDFKNYKTKDGSIIKDGIEGRKYAFKPGNKLANFLGCTRKMALIIGNNLFVHAGIVPHIAKKYGVDDLNKIMSLYLWDKLKDPSEYNDILQSAEFSPMWNRVFGNIKYQHNQVDVCNDLMVPLTNIYKVDKIFVGHTPQMDGGIGNVCNKKVWLADYGMSKAFDNYDDSIKSTGKRSKYREAQVLEILHDKHVTILKHNNKCN